MYVQYINLPLPWQHTYSYPIAEIVGELGSIAQLAMSLVQFCYSLVYTIHADAVA